MICAAVTKLDNASTKIRQYLQDEQITVTLFKTEPVQYERVAVPTPAAYQSLTPGPSVSKESDSNVIGLAVGCSLGALAILLLVFYLYINGGGDLTAGQKKSKGGFTCCMKAEDPSDNTQGGHAAHEGYSEPSHDHLQAIHGNG